MTRVLIVDDSALVRKVLTRILSEAPGIEVVGTAVDPYVARERIQTLKPDVITLDIEMPKMDGLTFLDKLMQHFPLPVVVVSSVAPERSAAAIRALELGAIDVVCKPDGPFSLPEVAEKLVRAVQAASHAKPRRVAPRNGPPANASVIMPTDGIIAIASSTGGVHAVERVLTDLPPTTPGVVIVQHMPQGFTAPFADRLKTVCGLDVREAKEGDVVARGRVLIAKAGRHMRLRRSGNQLITAYDDGPPVHHVKPAADILMKSVAEHARNAVGVVLTGMGADGAAGLLAMRRAGAATFAQSAESCVVYGMPKAAVEIGAVDKSVALDAMASAIIRHFSARDGARAGVG